MALLYEHFIKQRRRYPRVSMTKNRSEPESNRRFNSSEQEEEMKSICRIFDKKADEKVNKLES